MQINKTEMVHIAEAIILEGKSEKAEAEGKIEMAEELNCEVEYELSMAENNHVNGT